MQPIQIYENHVIIQAASKTIFCSKVEELLLSPPEWVSKHVQTVRQTLDGIPSEIASNYNYSPTYTYNGVRIAFECAKNDYKLTLMKNESSPECLLQILQKNQSPKVTLEHKSEKQQPLPQQSKAANEVVYRGPITTESVNQFPQDLQKYADKLSKSDFPYSATITSNGSVKVEGSVSIVGEKINLSDFLKRLDQQKQ